MSGSYKRCPNCGEKDNDWTVYGCNKCHLIFCTGCADSEGLWIFSHSTCPGCGGNNFRQVGSIERPFNDSPSDYYDREVNYTPSHEQENETQDNFLGGALLFGIIGFLITFVEFCVHSTDGTSFPLSAIFLRLLL